MSATILLQCKPVVLNFTDGPFRENRKEILLLNASEKKITA